MPAAFRRLAFVLVFMLLAPGAARADWFLVPYAGLRFGGSTSLLVLDTAVDDRTFTLGVSVVSLGRGILGIEGDFGIIPGFFESGSDSLVRSNVTSLGANLVLTLPLALTREGLRPYVVAGGGALRASARDFSGAFNFISTMPAITLGGGATGFFSESTGVRFDIRLLRSLGEGDDVLIRPGNRLRYWRGTIGLVRRF
jgi:hypothetical protein